MKDCEQSLDVIRERASQLERRPRVYFEEWNDPLISGIGWVSELISIAGGEDCFAELASASLARNRIIDPPEKVIEKAPDIIIGSWCGKKFRPEQVSNRSGWMVIPAVKHNALYEIKSAEILQPGPAALIDGVTKMHEIISQWTA